MKKQKLLGRSLTLVGVVFFLFASLFGVASASTDDAAVPALVASMGIGLFMLWFGFIGTMMLINIAGIAFWIYMIIDVAKREFPNKDDRLLWILVVVLAGWIGALIYYFVVKRKLDNK